MTITLSSRYDGLATVTLDGVPSLAQRPVPPIVDYPDSLVHVIAGDETLDQLAFVYYGREDLWWRIADANPGRFPLDWKAGDQVVIPPLRVATLATGR